MPQTQKFLSIVKMGGGYLQGEVERSVCTTGQGEVTGCDKSSRPIVQDIGKMLLDKSTFIFTSPKDKWI